MLQLIGVDVGALQSKTRLPTNVYTFVVASKPTIQLSLFGLYMYQNETLCAPLADVIFGQEDARGRLNEVPWEFVTCENWPFPYIWSQNHVIASPNRPFALNTDKNETICVPDAAIITFSKKILHFFIVRRNTFVTC